MMKFPTFCLFLLAFLLLMPTTSFGAEAAKPIKLYMNEKPLQTPDVTPRIVSGNTIVPLRVIVEEIGAKVAWDEATRKVTIKKDEVQIELVIDQTTALINGKQTKLEVGPKIENGSTMLPLRFIGELLGIEFKWDGPTSSVHMFKPIDGDSKPVTGPVDVEVPEDGKDTKPNPGTGTTFTPADGVHLVTAISMSETELTVTAKDGTLTPKVLTLTNPSRLVFDFPNTTLDEPLRKLLVKNLGELPSKQPQVTKVRFSNYSDDPATVRIILDLNGPMDYQVQSSKLPNQWKASIGERKLTVVIDAGHGDNDPGALSITGKNEKDFTLATAKKVEALLAKDKRIHVLMTRSDDTFIPLDGRVSFANDISADLFLSIHGNSAKATVSGTETYYNRPESLAFATVVHKFAIPATGFPDRKVREADFRVITKTSMPAVLLEVGYLSNKNDEAAMYKEEFQDKLAAALVSAIKEYLNLK
ncbi:N-acetylmuramoyl-L-alanine amidase family protein [Paenibacillus roseipurpureus]|uniref:N-acetylmuramoyl-L-alanine amidase family protein n=1 Tax=Paenibacillus roseopurpureus TaxID=2918901 RepID=A0AA96RIR2_9BACL|nr:N-acetylmuramoyl-L-alanine amidase family protein [Paenibacillus sp. MBLB1832]WNR42366.1 N-acetylmuramoyl-L-alanine amidase family protein [Paenibacillus sp. MBLB1832]